MALADRIARRSGIAWVAGLLLLAAASSARDAEVRIETVEVAPGLHVLYGRGGNIAVSTGSDGPLIIDDQFAPLHGKIVAAIEALQPGPVRFVINTHWHADHTGGNEAFGEAGALIVAHDNVRKRMKAGQVSQLTGRTTPPAPEGALPVLTFDANNTLYWNDETIRLEHVPAAHTDGDTLVWFERANTIHMGDTLFNGQYPFIDVGSGGSIDGLIRVVDSVLGRIDATTKVIPGHGKLADKADLEAYRAMLVDVRERVREAQAAGEDRDAWIATAPLADLEPEFGGGFLKGEQLLFLVWESLAKP
ncbi:MAG: MBL fold metallo-hydrolase [Myxococcota bacterium]|nr:MBL fold metallo-hydrolase [Myxococcota bacterium]